MATITHEQLSSRLQALQLPVTAHALHGTITGLACAGVSPDHSSWLEQLSECLDGTELEAHREAMVALQTLVARDLADGELAFQPLLPDGEEFLSLRVQALGRWSESFICGFIANTRELSPEQREILDDIAAISLVDDEEPEQHTEQDTEEAQEKAKRIRSSLNNPETADSNERDFMELCEYVRMAAMDLYGDNRQAGSQDGVVV